MGVIGGYFQHPEPASFGLAVVEVLAICVSKFRNRCEETIVRP